MVDAIARVGTVTGAARRLHLTQPALSHALAELETKLGVQLFERSPRRMVPTGEGERLLETAEEVLELVERAEHDLRRFRDGCRGILRLSTECYTCYYWLPAVLAQFASSFPEVEVQLVPETSYDPLPALRDGRLDISIMHSEVTSTELASEPLFQDELVAVVAPEHAWAGRAGVEPQDFATEVLLLHTDPKDSTLMQEALEPAGVKPSRTLSLKLTEAVLSSAKAGLGVAAMARWAAAPELAAGRLVAVPIGAGLFRTWSVVMRRRERNRPALRRLIDLLKDGPLPERGTMRAVVADRPAVSVG
ncbi:MAG: LysR family transcriptional regulator [Gemmatimonadetes bacterium]|nr:LysR family transcriptional regulator [Gemmatimonadota bacterium]